jgi:hypothetical protein
MYNVINLLAGQVQMYTFNNLWNGQINFLNLEEEAFSYSSALKQSSKVGGKFK